MSTQNFTHKYDSEFDKLPIYDQYKLLIPFVGENYDAAEKKVLFIGESHFLPKKAYSRLKIDETWYKSNHKDYNFNDLEIDHLSTRIIINRDVINSEYKNKSHSIYRNLGYEFANCFGFKDYNDALPQIAFYNYFLRPSEVQGGSINNSWDDNVFSFKHLIAIDEVLKPEAIIFTSKKARSAFHSVRWSDDFKVDGERIETKVFYVPHPGCAWWNRESIKKNNFWNSKIIEIEESKINGRNKLQLILKSL